MPMTAANAELQLELNAIAQGITLLTDSGDQTVFTSGVAPWSRLSAHTPAVYPNGLETGGAIIPAVSLTNNLVDVAALTCRLAGIKVSVAADTDVAASRAVSDPFRITSITVDSGGNVAAVAGTEGVAFSETRAAAGGPPLIAVGSIEIGQVRFSSTTAAPVTVAEILTTIGTHRETAGYPTWEEDFVSGEVTFASALPSIHTGPTAKRVYASFSQAVLTEVPFSNEFVAPEETSSVSSTQVYGGKTVGAVTKSLNNGSFSVVYQYNGIRDPIIAQVGQRVWVKYYPDPVAYPDDYVIANGILGKTNTNSAGANITGAFTLSPDFVATNVVG